MKGRKSLPTALKVLRGNPGHRPKADLGHGEPDPEVMLGQPPPRLNADGCAYWFAEGAQLLKTRVITAADQDAFADLCYLHQRKLALVALLARLEKKKLPTAADILSIGTLGNQLLKLTDRMAKARIEFGMTPASRTRVKINTGQGELNFGADSPPSALTTILSRDRSA